MACSCAFTKLEEVSQKLQDGSITVLDLKMIEKGFQQIKRLLKSVTAQSEDEGSSVDKSIVDQRLEELQHFKKQHISLLHLCERISPAIRGNSIKCDRFYRL